MSLSRLLPFWKDLTPSQQESLTVSTRERSYPRNSLIHGGNSECAGLILVRKGQLRVYMISDSGKEVTLYHLLDQDICLFSASCAMRNIQFDIFVSAAEDTDLFLIPPGIYQKLMEESLAVSNFTNQLMASRFTEVIWLVEQVMFKAFDSRLAAFLMDERGRSQTELLRITHEEIARHLGSAREVVSRMLKHFQEEGFVRLSRGGIKLEKPLELEKLAESSQE